MFPCTCNRLRPWMLCHFLVGCYWYMRRCFPRVFAWQGLVHFPCFWLAVFACAYPDSWTSTVSFPRRFVPANDQNELIVKFMIPKTSSKLLKLKLDSVLLHIVADIAWWKLLGYQRVPLIIRKPDGKQVQCFLTWPLVGAGAASRHLGCCKIIYSSAENDPFERCKFPCTKRIHPHLSAPKISPPRVL